MGVAVPRPYTYSARIHATLGVSAHHTSLHFTSCSNGPAGASWCIKDRPLILSYFRKGVPGDAPLLQINNILPILLRQRVRGRSTAWSARLIRTNKLHRQCGQDVRDPRPSALHFRVDDIVRGTHGSAPMKLWIGQIDSERARPEPLILMLP
jgi:hypothetical protein